MLNLQGISRYDYGISGELPAFDAMLQDYWNKSRDLETKTIFELEKSLWLANGAAATVSIGYLQTAANPSVIQYYGAWVFVIGIFLLVVLKFVSAFASSRDRARFQNAKSLFDAGEETDLIFGLVRDKTFRIMNRTVIYLQLAAGAAFLGGCIATLLGLRYAL